MPQSIEQPARPDPVNRLPPYLRPNLSDDAQRTLDALDRQSQRRDVPAMAITRLDIPFEDVFALVVKVFAAQAIIAIPIAFVIWLAFLR